jgi:hypothetical protein
MFIGGPEEGGFIFYGSSGFFEFFASNAPKKRGLNEGPFFEHSGVISP